MQSSDPIQRNKSRSKAISIAALPALALLYILSALVISTASDHQAPGFSLEQAGPHSMSGKAPLHDTLNFVSWNMMRGRGPKGAYNGSESRMPVSGQDKAPAWSGILAAVEQLALQHDLLLLQEADMEEGSPFFTLSSRLPNASIACATNHTNNWLPWPFSRERSVATGMAFVEPNAGSKDSDTAASFLLEGSPRWPSSLWKEGAYVSIRRFPRWGGLVVMNLSLPVLKDTIGATQAFALVRAWAEEEYQAGNPVVLAGDWGMMPANFHQDLVSIGGVAPEGICAMPEGMMPPDWLAFFDPMRPTLRSLAVPYNEHGSQKTTTDFFICSPNVRVLGVKTLDYSFEHSNHQPVSITFLIEP